MTDIEFRTELDNRYFARCVWVEEDLESLDGAEDLTDEQKCELMNRAKRNMEDRMCETGWEVLQYKLDQMLGK